MADFYGALLTTSFRVKDPAAYAADPVIQHFLDKAQTARFGVDLPKTPDDYTALGWDDQYPGSVDMVWDDETNDEVEYNLAATIQKHIHPEDACIIQVSGSEKLRYVGGEIAFVTSKGTVWFPFGSNAWDDKMDKKRVYDLLTTFGEQCANVGL
jgi:hypothetical protein